MTGDGPQRSGREHLPDYKVPDIVRSDTAFPPTRRGGEAVGAG